MRTPATKLIHEAARKLRKAMPADLPVSVRIVDRLPGACADCDRKADRYLIRILAGQEITASLIHLAHEWAHAVTWQMTHYKTTDETHDAHWGLANARAYQIVSGDP